MTQIWKFMLLCGLICGYITSGLTKPADEYDYNVQGDDGDDYTYDDDENASVDKSGNTEYNNVALEPEIEVDETETEVKPDEMVKLTCRVKNLSSKTVVTWNIGDRILTMDSNTVSNDKRFHVDSNKNLIIDHVQAADEGVYTCKILPQGINMKVKLVVSRSPTVRIYDNVRDISGSVRTYREGEKIILDCRPSGTPEPSVTWSSHGVRIDRVNGVNVEGGRLTIERAEHHHARVYQCLADNSIGKPAHESVTINIHYAPKVSAHRHEVNTGEGYDAELFCNYKSDPVGRSTWLRDGTPLVEGSKYRMTEETHGHHNRTGLVVRKVHKSDLGSYQCQVDNRLGRQHTNVSLIYEPELAHFDGYELQSGHLVVLNWTVRSVQPLSDILLYYQKSVDKQWTSEKPLVAEKHKEHSGVWLIQHRVQLSPGTWHARVKSRNTEGWSKYSEMQIINVPIIYTDNEDHLFEKLDSTETSGTSRIISNGFSSTSLATILVATLFFCVRWT